MAARRRRVGLAESFEDVRQKRGVDAFAGVGDRNFQVRAHALERTDTRRPSA